LAYSSIGRRYIIRTSRSSIAVRIGLSSVRLIIIVIIIVRIIVAVIIIIAVVVVISVRTRIVEIWVIVVAWIITIHPGIAPTIRKEWIVVWHVIAVVRRKRTVETTHITEARIYVGHSNIPATIHAVIDARHYSRAISIIVKSSGTTEISESVSI
jgi:hypothetical protein